MLEQAAALQYKQEKRRIIENTCAVFGLKPD